MPIIDSMAYLVGGLIYLIVFAIPTCIFIHLSIKGGNIKILHDRKKCKHGWYIGKLLFAAGIIRFSMDIAMIHDSVNLHDYVFEALEFCQQASYFIIILFVGSIYDKAKYDSKCFMAAIWFTIVCFMK